MLSETASFINKKNLNPQMRLLIHDTHLDKAEKMQIVLAYLLQLSLIVAMIVFLIRENWLNLFSTLGILLLTFLPAIIRRSFKVHLPMEMELFIILITYGALFLGEMHGYYTKFWWWDDLLHSISGVLFAIVGFLLIFILNEEKPHRINLSPAFQALFAFAFSVMIGVVWEIFEFIVDQSGGFSMQEGPFLYDTMTDIIENTITASLVSLLGFWYLKKWNSSVFLEEKIRKFFERNESFFKRE